MSPHAYIPEDERRLITIKPSVLSIVVRPLWSLCVIALLALAAHEISARVGPARWGTLSVRAAGGLIGARLVWEALVWASRRYVLTDRRVLSIRGVFQRHAADIALERVQHVLVYKTLRERIFGLGTLGFASAGTGAPEVAWVMIARPHRTLRIARRTIGASADPEHEPGEDRDRGIAIRLTPESRREADAEHQQRERPDASQPETREAPDARAQSRPVIIGLAGGIGAGKSRVAREFERAGCLVLDSDAQAKEALRREDVRRELVAWWGEGILDESGRIDRGRVAEIVFNDPKQRSRLEGLIHPLVKQSRDEMIAAAGDRPAVVIDAPLLFEAGVDAECDAVVFVDAPRAVRLERVRHERGWDDAELARRESAQLDLAEKRRRSTRVIANTGAEADLRAEVERTLGELGARGGATGG